MAKTLIERLDEVRANSVTPIDVKLYIERID